MELNLSPALIVALVIAAIFLAITTYFLGYRLLWLRLVKPVLMFLVQAVIGGIWLLFALAGQESYRPSLGITRAEYWILVRSYLTEFDGPLHWFGLPKVISESVREQYTQKQREWLKSLVDLITQAEANLSSAELKVREQASTPNLAEYERAESHLKSVRLLFAKSVRAASFLGLEVDSEESAYLLSINPVS